ncbi:hypothetical protein IWQ54_006509 [Labrenzia sp. EL_195]|nr:hypothetical protein [Labrenzia sp. EL_195]
MWKRKRETGLPGVYCRSVDGANDYKTGNQPEFLFRQQNS